MCEHFTQLNSSGRGGPCRAEPSGAWAEPIALVRAARPVAHSHSPPSRPCACAQEQVPQELGKLGEHSSSPGYSSHVLATPYFSGYSEIQTSQNIWEARLASRHSQQSQEAEYFKSRVKQGCISNVFAQNFAPTVSVSVVFLSLSLIFLNPGVPNFVRAKGWII